MTTPDGLLDQARAISTQRLLDLGESRRSGAPTLATLTRVPSFAELLADHDVVLADGATGTNYQDMGIVPGVAPEEWVFDAP